MDAELKGWIKFWLLIIFIIFLCIGGGLYGCPQYNVYAQRMSGQATLAEAQASRQTKVLEARATMESAVLEARATMESAQLLAQAEVRRATGAAEANHILQGSLGGPAGYLRYLQIQTYHELASNNRASIVYVPTEGGLPITEASRLTPVPTTPAPE